MGVTVKNLLSFCCIATVALSAASLLAQNATGYSVKGYHLGMSVADVRALQAPFKQKLKPCAKPNALGIASCQAVYPPRKGETIANVRVVSMEFHFIDNKLYSFSATFPADRFDHMSNALIAQWNQPKSRTVQVLHLDYCPGCRFRYPARCDLWSDGAASATLEERGVVNLVDVAKPWVVNYVDAARLQVDDLTLVQEVHRRLPARKTDL